MKNTKQNIIRSLNEFDDEVNLYRLISGGESKGLITLRKIVDKIHSDAYSNPGTKLPSILIHGKEGTRIHALALLNSLCISDIRECESRYFDAGMNSKEIFEGSRSSSAHLLTNVHLLRSVQESTIWRYLRTGRCAYHNYVTKTKEYIHCNGMIILTANDIAKVAPPILSSVDYKVEIEPYNQSQLELIVHMKLKFCGIDYGDDEEVLKTVTEYGNGQLSLIIDFLKACELMFRCEPKEVLDLKLIQRASKLI